MLPASSAAAASVGGSQHHLLRDNCERAWDVEPDATLDESRLRLHSRYCSFVTQVRLYP